LQLSLTVYLLSAVIKVYLKIIILINRLAELSSPVLRNFGSGQHFEHFYVVFTKITNLFASAITLTREGRQIFVEYVAM